MHGGEVCAHSDGPGKGAQFVVELPLDGAAADDAGLKVGKAAASRRRVLTGGHLIEVAYNGPRHARLLPAFPVVFEAADLSFFVEELRRQPRH